MTDVAVGLLAVVVGATLVGAGWSPLLSGLPLPGTLGFLFRSWVCAIAVGSLTVAWCYPLNVPGRWIAVVIVGTGALGYGVLGAFGRRPSIQRMSRPEWLGLLAALAVTVVAVLPAVASPTRLTVGQRIGPDAVGYAVSARAIGDGLTRSKIEAMLVAETGARSAEQAVFPKTPLVDATASFSVQVMNEFMTGADRWALPVVAGSVISLIGAGHLWSLLSLLAAFGLLSALVGVYTLVRALTGSWAAALLGIVLLGMSSSVLDNWHEGGLAEMWILPVGLLLAVPILCLDEIAAVSAFSCVAVGSLALLPAYNEGLLAYGPLYLAAMLVSLPVLGRRWWRTWSPIVAGGLVGSALVAPESAGFASTLLRSLRENGAAGWAQPHWPSFAEALGVGDPYASAVVAELPRSRADLALDGIADALGAGMMLGLVLRAMRRPASILLVSVIGVVAGVYLKTRCLDGATSYQYFKGIVLLVAPGAVALSTLFGSAMASRSRSPVRVAAVLLATAVGLSGLSYVATYRAQGSVVPPSYSSLAGSAAARSAFDRYNVVSISGGLEVDAIGTEVNLYWIGRNAGNPASPVTDLVGRRRRPVGTLVLLRDCPRWACLSKVGRLVVFRGDGVALVSLRWSTQVLVGYPEAEWPVLAARRYSALGGRFAQS